MEKKLSSSACIKQSPMIECIRKNCRLGLMDKINSNGGGDILVQGENLTEAEWKSMI
jgi:hypothetical protein